jgi:hypothetical protein
MLTRRVWLPIALLLALGGCREAAGPVNEPNGAGSRLGFQGNAASGSTSSPALHILQQSPTAPPLETYRVSFWASHARATTVAVDYQPAAGQSVGQQFLRFHIPKFALKWGPDGKRLYGSDSVLITLTIDPVDLAVEFQPSGVAFSRVLAPQLVIWYANANPDLNGDGVVDATDATLEAQLAIWGHTTKTQGWFKLVSNSDTNQQFVASRLYHFSGYAVSW